MILSPDTKRKLAEAMVALEQDKPNKAAGHLREVADALNAQAAEVLKETTVEHIVHTQASPALMAQPRADIPPQDFYLQARNLESCKNKVHVYAKDQDGYTIVDHRGWAVCLVCDTWNVTPKDVREAV